MSSVVLEVGRSVDIQELCFQAAKRTDMICVEVQVCLFADCQEGNFQFSKRSDNCSIIVQEGRFIRNVEIVAVHSSNLVDLLMNRNRVFRQRNDQKCAFQS